MALPAILKDNLRIPVVASPMFIISHPPLVLAQCKAGMVGAQKLVDRLADEYQAAEGN